MTDFALPLSIARKATKVSMHPLSNVHKNVPPTDARIMRTIEFPGDLWHLRIEFPPLLHQEFFEHEAFWNGVRGQAHRFLCWHLLRSVPRGTLRGSPTLGGSYSAGVNQIVVVSSDLGTLMKGDYLGITLLNNKGTQLIQVRDVSTNLFNNTIQLVAPLRWDAAGGTPVIWQRPTARFILTKQPIPTYEMVVSEGYSIEAIEAPML